MKERLVGAAVLVALGVWLIPWVLNGPEQSGRTESDVLELPAAVESSPLRSQTITLDDDREPPTRAVVQSEPETALVSNAVVPDPPTEEAPPMPSVSAAPSRPPADSSPVADESGWYVQIGSYADEENALRQADRVSSYGFEARVSSFVASGRPMRRVRVGPQSSRTQADTVASSLSAHGFVVQVVRQD